MSLAVTAVARLALVVAVPAALMIMVAGIKLRSRPSPTGPMWLAAAGASAVFTAAVVAGWALPDAHDRLPIRERRSVREALAASPACEFPFSRVLDIKVSGHRTGAFRVTFTCGLTHLGIPRLKGSADCQEGQWSGAGWLDMWRVGDCTTLLRRSSD